MIYAVSGGAEVTVFCLYWVSFATFKAHTIRALVLVAIAQAASEITLVRVNIAKPLRKSIEVVTTAQMACRSVGLECTSVGAAAEATAKVNFISDD